MKNFKHLLAGLAILCVLATGCKKSVDSDDTTPTRPVTPTTPTPPPNPTNPNTPAPNNTPPGDNDHMLMGNLSNGGQTPDSINNYLMRKTYFATSYNNSRGIPNWVSWHLNSSDFGGTPRQDDFREDNTLPYGFYYVQHSNYTGSGFDRGHNCPSADRTSTTAANSATFLMTNMIPQAPNNNQQTWNNLEDYIRGQINTGKEAYVIMGNYGAGGTGSNGFATTINGGKITVPAFVWKVVVLIDNGDGDVARINTTTRVIAVITPNTNTINSNWKNYRTTVDAIETATGYDLLTVLPIALQDVLEAKVDNL